jgi:hypothetical protein
MFTSASEAPQIKSMPFLSTSPHVHYLLVIFPFFAVSLELSTASLNKPQMNKYTVASFGRLFVSEANFKASATAFSLQNCRLIFLSCVICYTCTEK